MHAPGHAGHAAAVLCLQAAAQGDRLLTHCTLPLDVKVSSTSGGYCWGTCVFSVKDMEGAASSRGHTCWYLVCVESKSFLFKAARVCVMGGGGHHMLPGDSSRCLMATGPAACADAVQLHVQMLCTREAMWTSHLILSKTPRSHMPPICLNR